jgi:hypothetical protein
MWLHIHLSSTPIWGYCCRRSHIPLLIRTIASCIVMLIVLNWSHGASVDCQCCIFFLVCSDSLDDTFWGHDCKYLKNINKLKSTGWITNNQKNWKQLGREMKALFKGIWVGVRGVRRNLLPASSLDTGSCLPLHLQLLACDWCSLHFPVTFYINFFDNFSCRL